MTVGALALPCSRDQGELSGMSRSGAGARKPDDGVKERDAAQQFEALLIGQLLRSAREGGGGWLGSGGDSSSDCATEMAEQQLAATLSQNGGLGLAATVAEGLKKA
jgi:Rod binding domain-containing protein